MIILGLTGSIGMGKSTVAGFFAEAGVPVYRADEAVHALYQQPQIAAEIGALFPQAIEYGKVNRRKLAECLFAGKTEADQAQALEKLEAIIHPHIHAQERGFIRRAEASGAQLAALDIPLLLESEDKCAKIGQTAVYKREIDYIAVVSAPAAVQRERVLARPNMSKAKFAAILARQMPDSEKRKRADFIIDTGQSLAETRAEVRALVAKLTAKG